MGRTGCRVLRKHRAQTVPAPPRATGLSTATIMFAANLTLGLYVHLGPKPPTPNSTVELESVPLGGTEQPLAAPTSYLTLVPLVATMLFIMGRCGSDPTRMGGGGAGAGRAEGQLERGRLGLRCGGRARARAGHRCPGLSGWLGRGLGSSVEAEEAPCPLCRQATPWAGGPSPGS